MDRTEIGAKLRRLREAKGLTLREVGERAGVTFQYVSDVEKGEANVTIGALERISEAVGSHLLLDVQDKDPVFVKEALLLSANDRKQVWRVIQVLKNINVHLRNVAIRQLERWAEDFYPMAPSDTHKDTAEPPGRLPRETQAPSVAPPLNRPTTRTKL